MTREVTDNLYIELGYFTPEEYYVYTAEAESAIASTAGFVCDATATATVDFSADLSVNAGQTATASKIIEVTAEFSGVFSPTMTVIAIRNLGASVNVYASLSVDVERNRAVDIALDTIADLNAQAIRVIEYSADLLTNATLSAEYIRSNRSAPTPVVYAGDIFSNLAITTADKKWGAGSLKIDANSSSLIPNSVTYLSGTYYAVHDSYTWSSTDGIDWTRANSDLGISFPNIQTLNNRLVVFSSNTIKTSTDGQTWTSYTGPGTIGAITYNNNLWIVAISATSPSKGHITYTSPDLTTWTQRDSVVSGSGYSSYSIRDLKTSGTTTFLLTTYTLSTGGTYSAIRKSSNGTTWSSISAVTADLYDLANDGAGNWVISVNNNYTYYTATNTSTNLTARTSTKYIGNLFYNSLNSTWYNFSVADGQAYTSANTYPTFTWTLTSDITKFPTKQQSNVIYGYSNGLFYSTTDAVNYDYEILGQQENLRPWIEYQEDTRYSSWKTIDFWYLASSNTGRQFSISNTSLQSRGWLLTITTGSTNHSYSLANYTANNSAVVCSGTVSSQLANTWHHVRIAYDNGIATIFVNGSRITGTNASERNIGALRTLNSPLTVNNLQYNLNQSSNAAEIYIDELLITDELLTAPTATSYTVPTGAYTNTDQTDLLLHFNTDFTDDVIRPLYASSDLSLIADLSVINQRLRDNSSGMSVVVSQQTDVEKVTDYTSALSTAAIVNADISVISEFSASLATQGFIIIAAGEIAPGVAGLSSAFSLNCASTRVKSFESLHTVTASLTANVQERDLASADLTANFALTASLKGLVQTGRANLTSTFTQTTNANENPLPTNPNVIEHITGFTLDLKPQFQLTKFGSNYNDLNFTGVTWIDIRSSTTPSSLDQIGSSSLIGPITILGAENNNPPQSQATLYGVFQVSVILGTRIDIDTVRYRRIFWTISDTDQFPILTWSDVTGWTYANIGLRIVADVNDPNYFKVYRNTAGSNYSLLSGIYNTTASFTDELLDGVLTFAPLQFLPINSVYNVSDSTANSPDFVASTNTVSNIVYTPVITEYAGPQEIGSADLRASFSFNLPEGLLVKFGEASLSASATQTANVSRIKTNSASLSVTTSQTTSATKAILAQASLSAAATQSSEATRTRTADSLLSSTAQISLTPNRIRGLDSTQISAFAQTTEIDRFRLFDSSLSVAGAIAANNNRLREFDSNFDVIASQLAAVARVGDGFIAADVNTSMTVDAVKTTDMLVALDSIADCSANAISIVTGSSNLQTSFTAIIDIERIKPVGAELSVAFTQNINAVKITDISKQLAVTANITAIDTRLREFSSEQTSAFSQSTDGLRVRFADSLFTVNTELFATFYSLAKAQAHLEVNGFSLTAGRVIHLDPYYTYIVPQETRAYIITEETREFMIEQETRKFII